MLSKSDFDSVQSFEISSFDDLLPFCKGLREKDPRSKFIIKIKESTSRLNIVFPFSNFYLLGEGKGASLIGNLYAKMKDKNGEELSTWKTATLKIIGNNNILENIMVANESGDPTNKGQEVALAIFGDNNLVISSHLESTQDTLFIGPLPDDLSTRYIGFLPIEERYQEGNTRNYFVDDKILGSVDFIFGAGQADFYHCEFISVNDGRNEGYVFAPAHSLKDDFGFFAYACSFLGKELPNSSIYLARPWRDYGKVVLSSCTYSSHIKKEGFAEWNNEKRYLTARFEEYPLSNGRVNWTKNKKENPLPFRYKKEEKTLESTFAYLEK